MGETSFQTAEYETVKSKYDYDATTGFLYIRNPREKRHKNKPIGCLDSYGYLITSYNGKTHKVHRLIWEWYYGQPPKGQIDHVNRNRIDNRIANLREADSKLQANNREDNLEQYNGCAIGFHKLTQKIIVTCGDVHIGLFNNKNEVVNYIDTFGIVPKKDLRPKMTISVSWHKSNKKFQAMVRHNKKPVYLGNYNTEEEAYEVANNYITNSSV